MKLDNTDINILKELEEDSRLSIREISKRVNLSPSSVSERIKKLEDKKIIEKYTIKINKKNLGLVIECIVEVKLENNYFKKFKQFINNHKFIEFCYRVTGENCIILKLVSYRVEEIEKFVDEVSELHGVTSTNIIFSDIPIKTSIENFINLK